MNIILKEKVKCLINVMATTTCGNAGYFDETGYHWVTNHLSIHEYLSPLDYINIVNEVIN